ncbi:MAG TPA: winged helix-turn-helix domain-containing protein [Vicinamibacterales bacterium]|nr:winged helix-turn-helix domain-containing protein [Vicinamibacterales bacterium]
MPHTSHRFGPFTVDRAAYRVTRDGAPVDLTPKLLDLLIHLVDHAGELVTKEDLLDALWPDANVTDNALTQAVSELRQALGDDAAAPRYIKTVARRGYRFVAPVAPAETTPAPPGAAAAAIDDRGIAVLDFTNVTGDADAAWLSAGIAETVSADLRALGTFRVVDRWRVLEAVRTAGGSLQAVAAALQVRRAVIGSFQTAGDRIRITARVVDVVSGEAVADAKVDGRLDAIFALQDEVASQFASELGLAARGAAAPARRETPSLEAYRAVMEGWLRVETLDVRELPRAIRDFERAVAIDPGYALAYNGLANAEFASYEATRADADPARDLLDRAIAHGRRAVQLDDALAEAHGTLALILVSAHDTAGAIKAARRAVALEPGNWRHLFRLGHASWGEERLRAGAATLALYPEFAFAYFQSAMVHVARGQLTEAERVLRHGAAIQDRQIGRGERYPALGLHWLLGLVRLAQDDTSDAIVEFDRERALAAPHRLYGREYTMHAHVGQGAALLRLGRSADAARAFEAALAHYPHEPLAETGLAVAAGRPFDPAAIARPLTRGIALAALGRVDEAASLLDRTVDAAPPGFTGWWLPAEPFLRQHTEHKALSAVMKRLADRAR